MKSDSGKLKSLRIQTGVVQRLNNELRYYTKEADSLKLKYEKLRESKDIGSKQGFEVWQDAQKVIPQVVLQLQVAHKELEFILTKDFANIDVVFTTDASPEIDAVLLARTQIERTLQVIPHTLTDSTHPVDSEDQEY